MGDYARRLVWETEGRRGAAERGWLGEDERRREEERQEEEWRQHHEDRDRRDDEERGR